MSVSLAPIWKTKSIHIPSSWQGHSICQEWCFRLLLWTPWCLAHALTHAEGTCASQDRSGFFRYLRKVVGTTLGKGPTAHIFITITVSHMYRRRSEVWDTRAVKPSVCLSVPQGEIQDRYATQIQSLQLQESNLLRALWYPALGAGEARTQVWRWVHGPQGCLCIMEKKRKALEWPVSPSLCALKINATSETVHLLFFYLTTSHLYIHTAPSSRTCIHKVHSQSDSRLRLNSLGSKSRLNKSRSKFHRSRSMSKILTPYFNIRPSSWVKERQYSSFVCSFCQGLFTLTECAISLDSGQSYLNSIRLSCVELMLATVNEMVSALPSKNKHTYPFGQWTVLVRGTLGL